MRERDRGRLAVPTSRYRRPWLDHPQVIEHVTAANERILRLLRKVVVHSPLAGQTRSFDDEDMPYLFYGGGGPAPPGLDAPQGRLTERDASLTSFRASVRSLTSWFDEVDIDLRECAVEHPAFGLFDGAQWLLFTAVHMQQHRGQVLDIRCASDRATGPLV